MALGRVRRSKETSVLGSCFGLLRLKDACSSDRCVCYASLRALGAICSYRDSQSVHRPTAFASRSFFAFEKDYRLLEREVVALIFGVTRSHQDLGRRHLEAVTHYCLNLLVLIRRFQRQPSEDCALVSYLIGIRLQTSLQTRQDNRTQR